MYCAATVATLSATGYEMSSFMWVVYYSVMMSPWGVGYRVYYSSWYSYSYINTYYYNACCPIIIGILKGFKHIQFALDSIQINGFEQPQENE
jgi:hypothetical protein